MSYPRLSGTIDDKAVVSTGAPPCSLYCDVIVMFGLDASWQGSANKKNVESRAEHVSIFCPNPVFPQGVTLGASLQLSAHLSKQDLHLCYGKKKETVKLNLLDESDEPRMTERLFSFF